MRVKTLEITWHRREESTQNDPVLSIHFLTDTFFATCGGDNEIKLWKLISTSNDVNVKYVCSLKQHLKGVNVVRWSPDGKYLASGSDDGLIIVWSLNPSECPSWEECKSEKSTIKKVLRGHSMDVYDLCWSPDSIHLCSASIDNNIIIWDVTRDKSILQTISEHTQFIQGITWDPLDCSIVSSSNDRTVRVYMTPNMQFISSKPYKNVACKYVLKRRAYTKEPTETSSAPESSPVNKSFTESNEDIEMNSPTKANSPLSPTSTNNARHPKSHMMFLDEMISSFFRRLSFSPRGEFVILPTGMYQETYSSPVLNCSYVFLRDLYELPIAVIPSPSRTVVVRFNPNLYKYPAELNGQPPVGSLSQLADLKGYYYYCIVNNDGICIYDTLHFQPLFYIGDIHYSQICDIDWTPNGNKLICVSTDGYCTYIDLENELGEYYKEEISC